MKYPIQLIAFDLDGVLVDSRHIHYIALNKALSKVGYEITLEEHLARYDGLPTQVKLELLSTEKGLARDLHHQIWKEKQDETLTVIDDVIQPNPSLISLLEFLSLHYTLACASNSVRKTLEMTLEKLGIRSFFKVIASNEDVQHPKPSSQIYTYIMSQLGVSPYQTLIIEDSPIGRNAACMSGAHVMSVSGPEDVTLKNIHASINCALESNKKLYWDLRWKSNIQVVIPMAGLGSRFATDPRYKGVPKPLIKVHQWHMIELVIRNLNVDGDFFFILQRKHVEEHPEILETLRESTHGRCTFVYTDGLTEGPACSVLLCEPFWDASLPLLIANCDQYVEWNSNEFLYRAKNMDGCIQTFYKDPAENDTKWSYVRLDDKGWVSELQEKNVISDKATTGIYYWKSADLFSKCAKSMIASNARVNNEFYVGPVYNVAIQQGLKVGHHACKQMWGIGVPDDLDVFLAKKQPQSIIEHIAMT